MRLSSLLPALFASAAVALPADSQWAPWAPSSNSSTIPTVVPKTSSLTGTTSLSTRTSSTPLTYWGQSSTPYNTTTKSNSTTIPSTPSQAWNTWTSPSPKPTLTWDGWTNASYSSGGRGSLSAGSNGKGSGFGRTSSLSSSSSSSVSISGAGYSGSSNGFGSGSWSGTGTDSATGPLDNWFRQSASAASPVPTATLLPSFHQSQDKTDPANVKASDHRQQYYVQAGASSSTTHQFAWLSTNFTNNAIVLDHSDLFEWDYSQSTELLAFTFANKATFNLARSTWHTDMIIVYYDGTCGTAMNCYLICNSLAFDSESDTCTMSTSTAKFEDVATYFEFEWGNYVSGNVATTTSDTTMSGSITTPAPLVDTNTSGYDNDNHCTAPAETLFGLPTACLGQHFDEDLDDFYRHVALADTDFADFAIHFNGDNLYYENADLTDLDSEDYSDDDISLSLSRRTLMRRWSLSDLNPLKTAKDIGDTVLSILPQIPGINKPYEISLVDKTIPLNIPSTRQTVTSPWGEQVLIKSLEKESDDGTISGTIDMYCVDCGTSGTATLNGKIGIDVAEGVDYITADLSMNLAIGLKLGLVADVEYNGSISQPLFTVPLSTLTVGIVTIGPYLKAGVELDLDVAAKGQILGGGTLSFVNSKISVDVTSFTGSASGWTPSFDPVFEAEGEVTVSADFGVPIAIALGITALEYSAEVSIVERPAIIANAQAEATANLDGAAFVSLDGCAGVSAGLSFKNDLYAQFSLPGLIEKKFDMFSIPEKSLYSTCIALPAASQPTDTGSGGGIIVTGSAAASTTGFSNSTATSPATSATSTGNNTTSSTTTSATTTGYSEPYSSSSSTGTPDSSSNGGIYVDTTSTALSNATINSTPFIVPDSNDVSYDRTDGVYISTLIDTTAQFQAYTCSNGNIYAFGIDDTNILASDCQSDISMYQDDDVGNVAVADGYSRIFIYYPDEMNATGVSRIRVVDFEDIPTGSEEIVWILGDSSLSNGTNLPVYYSVDQNFNVYYPAMCSYKSNVPNKMFLMKEPEVGLARLSETAIKYSITGGDIDTCWYLPLVEGSGHDEKEDGWSQWE